MQIVETDQTGLEQLVATGCPVLAVATAVWCGPCKRMAPVYENFVNKFPEVIVAKIDIDVNKKFAQRTNVMGVPTMFVYHGGSLKGRQTGACGLDKLVELFESSI